AHQVGTEGATGEPPPPAVENLARLAGDATRSVGPQIGFRGQAGFLGQPGVAGQRPHRKFSGAIIGVAGGAVGIIFGGAAALTAVMPSSALWTSAIICGGPNQLTYNTSHYSYKPGQSGTSVSFQCVSPAGTYDVNDFAIMGLQALLVALVLGVAVGVGVLINRLLPRPLPNRKVIIVGVPVLLAAAAAIAFLWQTSSSSTLTQVPTGASLTLHGNGDTRTVACNGGHLTVTGRDFTVTITGHCGRLSVDGVINHVTVDAVDIIDVDGVNNVVTFHTGSPQITNNGLKNTIQQG
ncbi:MAG TPA: DUF3060 domain-containing protein, partial [Mycobacterium sp.]|nr:DUF3060 domain-containing protein [Mycobacterium sp.]